MVTIKQLLLILIVLVTLNAFSVHAQVCGGNIAVSTNMVANLNCPLNGVRIIGNNLVFDCKGFNITGGQMPGRYGIWVDHVSNVSIVNCNVRNFSYGLLIEYSNFSYVFNSTFENNRPGALGGYGILANYSRGCEILNNTANRNDISGIELYHSSFCNITGNLVGANDDYGILLQRNSQHNRVIRNIATGQLFFDGIAIRNPLVQRNNFNTVMYNRAYDNPAGGFAFGDLEFCNITHNLAYNNSGNGFTFSNVADNNNISNNTAYNNTGDGFSFNNADNNNITDNVAFNNRRGFYLSTTIRNRIFSNSIYNNREEGIQAFNDVSNTYLNNSVYYNNGTGIWISVSGRVTVINNSVYNNTGNGLFFSSLIPFVEDFVHGNNLFNNNLSGMFFQNSGNVSVWNNRLTSNNLFGFNLQSSSKLNISFNTLLNHTYSINLTGSGNNTIYNNYFEGMPYADAASTNNSWNIAKTLGTNIIGGPFLGGNFWSLYNGIDTNKDGLGNTLTPWKGLTNAIVNGGDDFPLVNGSSTTAQMLQSLLNSSFGTNFTFENLTCFGSGVSTGGGNITFHGYFFKDTVPQFSILNRSFYNGTNTSNDEAFGVAVDSNDSMIVVGKLNSDWAVVKYDKNGNYLWNWTGPSVSTNARAVAVDILDNVLVTGQTFIGGKEYAWTVKLDPNGNHLWNRTISGIAPFWQAQGRGITSDSNNSVIITGVRQEAGCAVCWDILLAKYDQNGNLLWSTVFGNLLTKEDEGEDVATDSQDEIIISGRWNNKGAVFKFNSTGSQLWNVTGIYAGASASNLYGVDTDSQDNVIAGGEFWIGAAVNVTIFKFNSTGSQVWNASTGGSGSDRGDGVAVDYEDNILLGGSSNSFGVSGINIYIVKYLYNGTKFWQYLGDMGLNERAWSIDTNSWGEPVIGGRLSPNSGGRRMLLANYKGFFDYNNTPSTITPVGLVNFTLTNPGETWRCDLQAYDDTSLSYTLKSNDVLIRSSTPTNIQCSRNVPNNFMNCSNLSYFDNITQVRVLCTAASSATFNLTNIYDGTTFFVNSTTNVVGGFLVLNNSDVQILDSGNWSLGVICNYSTVTSNASSGFFIPFGNLSNAQILTASQNVTNGNSFVVTTSIGCTGGECVNITVALDPLKPLVNLTQPTGFIQDVYADSEFLYGAADDSFGLGNDNFLYIWNKTDLSLFTTRPGASLGDGLQAVYADDEYIYTGGRERIVYIFNRTDYVVPFASVKNLSQLPGGHQILSLISDNNYLYAGLSGGASHVNVYAKPGFSNTVNLTQMSGAVQSLSKDDTYLYAGSHDCHIYLYNRSNLAQVPFNLSGPASPNCNVKAIDVDDTYIYAHGQLTVNFEAFTRVWNKTSYAIVADWNDTTMLDAGIAIDGGGLDYLYQGGIDTWWTVDGWLEQINKSTWNVSDRKNYTNLGIKSIFCDEDYLYVGTMINPWGWPNTNGSVMVFNNSCRGPVPPVSITINSVSILPSSYPVTTTTVQCIANVTTAGVVDTVLFNITFPDGSSILLNSTNAGDIYTSSNFTVNSTSDHNCTVNANNTNGSSASRTKSFFGGHKGIIPMNAGSPFYTTSQNPRNGSHQACLNSLIPGQNCTSTWNVVANGNPGDTWAFFSIYTGSNLNTSRINVTILGGPGPAPSGGGGGGATRAWQELQEEVEEIEAECVESWICDDWSECDYGSQSRDCVDVNACGTTKRKPPTTRTCKMPELIEPPVIPEEKPKYDLEKVEVITPKSPSWTDLFNKREFLRGALLVIIVASLIYLGALAKHLKKSAKPAEKKPIIAAKPVQQKPAPKPIQKKPPKKPVPKIKADTPEDLLKELNKL